MLAVTRLENVLCGNGYPVPSNPSSYHEGSRAGVDLLRPHTTAQGWKYCKESRLPKSMFDEDLLQLQRTTLST